MKYISTRGIILKTKNLNESDKILHLLTPDHGKIVGIAKGARKSKRRFQGCLELFSLLNFDCTLKKEGLAIITEAKLISSFYALRTSYGKLKSASALIELTLYATRHELSEKIMFDALYSYLKKIVEDADEEWMRWSYQALILNVLGMQPSLQLCSKCQSTDSLNYFSSEAGGVICSVCQADGKSASQFISENDRKGLIHLFSTVLHGDALPADGRSHVGKILSQFSTYHMPDLYR